MHATMVASEVCLFFSRAAGGCFAVHFVLPVELLQTCVYSPTLISATSCGADTLTQTFCLRRILAWSSNTTICVFEFKADVSSPWQTICVGQMCDVCQQSDDTQIE